MNFVNYASTGSTIDFEFDNEIKAQKALCKMEDIRLKYSVISLYDVKKVIGFSANASDNIVGWRSLGKAAIKLYGEKAVLVLPKPIMLVSNSESELSSKTDDELVKLFNSQVVALARTIVEMADREEKS
jgi:hypothetical protein